MNNSDENKHYKFESNFVMFDLKLKAMHIKNGYLLKNSINSLANFVDASRLRFSN